MSTQIQRMDVQVDSPPGSTFTWMHVSDIHFGHGREDSVRIDQKMVADELIKDARELSAQIGVPDALFITGDVAYKADSKREYPQAIKWIEDLRDSIRITREQVFIVPGNHDVERIKAGSGFTQRTFHSQLRQRPESIDDLLSSPGDLQHIWSKFEDYSQFAARYAAPRLEPRVPYWAQPLETSLGSVVIAGLNTALLSFDDDDSPASLALGANQIREAVHNQPCDSLLIVLMHHPPEWLSDGDRLESILQGKAHLLFCGHIHKRGAHIKSPLFAPELIRIAAGAGHTDPRDAPEHSYSLGRISHAGVHYFPRIWVPDSHEFRADRTNSKGMDESGALVAKRDKLPFALARWIPSPEPLLLSGVIAWINDPRGEWRLKLKAGTEKLDAARLQSILEHVRVLAEDVNVRLIAVDQDSPCLVFEGSQEGFERLERVFRSETDTLSDRLGVVVVDLDQVNGATLQSVSEPGEAGIETNAQEADLRLTPSEPFDLPTLLGISLDAKKNEPTYAQKSGPIKCT